MIGEISHFNSVFSQYEEKLKVEKDKLRKFMEGFSRNMCWFVGMVSYKLIKQKEPDAEKKEPEMQDLLMQSNLLSGGIEYRFMTSFSQDIQT